MLFTFVSVEYGIFININDDVKGDDNFHCDADDNIIDIYDVIDFAPSPIKTVLPIWKWAFIKSLYCNINMYLV